MIEMKFLKDTKGQTGIMGVLGAVILTVIAIIIISEFITVGNFQNATVTNLGNLLPVILMAVAVYSAVSLFGFRM